LVGVVHPRTAVRVVEESASADIQTMVGVSPSERGLSPPLFAVRKRIGWLAINLVTAFMAAAVVGLFEGTISQYTALAVLLPVVAGQSGNAGAQALAVTMRALTLREIGVRMWLPAVRKETVVGLINGLGIAAICAAGVYLWSGSAGLCLIIALAMVLSMMIAGLAGAMVPMILVRFGIDPAASSSIVLTTITDVAGFFSFLGIASALATLI
ncbi:MAG: magnesium transporter, partial [Rhizobiaceae bacterium]|nr:magnesium transporter [Rhizobiaceae bacterium]